MNGVSVLNSYNLAMHLKTSHCMRTCVGVCLCLCALIWICSLNLVDSVERDVLVLVL